MIHSVRYKCVLDTNVIYPIEIRDLLFWLAFYELYTPKWSKHIFDEWENVMRRKGILQDKIRKRTAKAQAAFPDALVKNYEKLIKTLDLPDMKDRHVLAAAIKTNADIIVTNNLKDFPQDYLANFGLKAKSADDFICDIIELNPDKAKAAFNQLVSNRKNPKMNHKVMLHTFRKQGLSETATLLEKIVFGSLF